MALRLASAALIALAISFLSAAAPAVLATAQAGERRVITLEDADYFGFDYKTLKNRSLEQCRAACLDDQNCLAFTYNVSARWCFLKNDFADLRATPGAVAGRVTSYDVAAEEAPALEFISRGLVRDAEDYAQAVAREPADPSQGSVALGEAAVITLSQEMYKEAAALYRLALRASQDNFDLWSGLAAASLRVDGDSYAENAALVREATSASILAYRTAPSADRRADALALLANALIRRNMYRPALEAYKESLLLADSAEVRAAYDELHEQHGFRIIDHTVDSESASPRACVRFSEELNASRGGFDDYVRVNQKSAASVSVDGSQLCIDGLEHGETYQVGLRAGIPSSIGEVLESPVSLTLYVRDRSPAVRFTGRNFVLPRVGAHGIPVIAVNTKLIDIELYRIAERALSETLTRDELFSQLNRYSANDIAENRGSLIWSGTLDADGDLNRETTISMPVGEALPERTPGIYVMIARPREGANESWRAQATQWFVVSDIGLSTLMGTDGLHVFARSLSTAQPMPNVEVTLVARNNTVLGTAGTDARGQVRFSAGLTRGTGGGAPAFVSAARGGSDFAFIDLGKPGFDLTDRGVEGRPAPGPLDVFIYTERGVYRPGATVHVAALMRDAEAEAVAGTPLTFIYTRPDGVEHIRSVVRDAGAGGYAHDLDLLDSAMRGAWRVAAHVDPKATPLAELSFLVEDFIPDRIEFDLETDAVSFDASAATRFEVAGRYLYGADAAGLRLEGELAVRPVTALAGFEGYAFGLADEQVLPNRLPLDGLPATDETGRAEFDVELGILPATTRPVEAELTLRMREGSGRAVERSQTLGVALQRSLIGIKPMFAGGTVGEGETAEFDIIAANPQGRTEFFDGATWELLRIERDFQWYEVDGRWNYEAVSYSTRVADGRVDIEPDAPVRIAAPVEWGRYRLEVTSADQGGPVSSFEFSAGWYVDVSSADTPDVLELTLDKSSYLPGDTARITISPRFSGSAVVMVMNERLIETVDVDVDFSGTTVELPVGEDWGAGAYVAAIAFRPTGTAASRMPGRAIGLAWLGVDVDERTIGIAMDTPDTMRPGDTLAIPVTLSGIEPGGRAFVTVAAVDVGILNLTRYQPPAPDEWYYGQRRLGLEVRDLYGRLIDAMLGAPGRIRSGGDLPFLQTLAAPPAQEPVALYSGIVETDAGGNALVEFDVPDFAGTLRVMAVAWTASAVGHAASDVIVRDPIVVTVSPPRFLAPGDVAQVRYELHNLEGPAGEYELSLSSSDELELEGAEATLTLASGERHVGTVTVSGLEPGIGQITVRLSDSNAINISRSYALAVRPAQPVTSERQVVSLEPGASLTLDANRLAGLVEGSGSLSVSASRAGALDIPSLLHALDRYPYGCAEQITSRALPLLYLADVASQSGLGREEDLKERVQKAVLDTLSHQSSSGGFGLWGPGSGDLWLNAYVTDFLTRARELGYAVPERGLTQALNNLQNVLGYAPDVDGAGEDVAYALYVLSRNRRASLGDLRYYVDTKLDAFGSAMAKAHIGAALALYGEQSRSRDAFDAALDDLRADRGDSRHARHYGSLLRDSAATLALAAESRPAAAPLDTLGEIVEDLRARATNTSTQENAWLLLAARALLDDTQALRFTLNGVAHAGNVMDRYLDEDLSAQPVTLQNDNDETIDVVLTATGVPHDALPAGGDGFSISRTYYTLDGTEVSIEEVGQNERFVVVLKVREETKWLSRLLVADLIPAGFQIDNPQLVQSADLASFSWLSEPPATAHLEFRDDRFVAALERSPHDEREFTLAYMLRAVTPGRYTVPPALVEDMYRPYFNARTTMGTSEVIGPRP